MDVFEAMETCRAIRFFTKEPVPDEMIDKILYAATRAPSPGNSQGWDFIVVTDATIKQALSAKISTVMDATVGAIQQSMGGLDALDDVTRRMLQGTVNMAKTLGDIPAIILVCGKKVYPPQAPTEQFVWSALYPAAQNILLAARALGLGTCFTTYQNTCEKELRELLHIPADVYIAAFIPVGWPAINFGPLARRPVEDFVHRNGWQGDLRA
ncbi:nitroreductase family protein [Iodidimonas sp. SYSU 1G8]|uniref:nitroreductase family protein n=1 Tax=Iodidimonas sp. SYSU 1G8 TaxID=3133967 RepID=UPI0031FE6A5F